VKSLALFTAMYTVGYPFHRLLSPLLGFISFFVIDW